MGVVVAVSAISVTVGAQQVGGETLDVRIVARKVASARVEFALQQREVGGGWGSGCCRGSGSFRRRSRSDGGW